MNELARKVHENAVKHGFYDDEREIGTLLMLCVSELSEALEADRKGRHAKPFESLSLEDFKGKFEQNFKDTFEDELADTIIRILDLCGYLKIDIEEHVRLKMKYNEMREKKHGKRY